MGNIVLMINGWILPCALIGMIYGIYHFFRPHKALYLQLITCGVGCLMFARLFYVIYMLTQGELNHGFHIGMLGIMGSFMFFLSANYGQMDGLVDDRTKTFRATRIKALFVPVLLACLYAVFYLKIETNEIRAAVGLLMLFILPCSYYNFKHVIIYDVDLGIISQLRKYNILAVVYAFLSVLELMGQYMEIRPLYIASGIGVGIICAVIIPVVKGGADKWTI